MKYTFVFLVLVALTLSATAQTPPEKSSDGESSAAKKVDPQFHADAIKLVEVSGAKQYLQENLENSIDEAEKMMRDKCPDCSPEFGKEWKKRFLERTKLDDYLDVYVRVYEKYLNDSEIKELIALKEDTTKTVVPSTQLKEKRASVMSSTRRTLTPARYISTSASSTELSRRR